MVKYSRFKNERIISFAETFQGGYKIFEFGGNLSRLSIINNEGNLIRSSTKKYCPNWDLTNPNVLTLLSNKLNLIDLRKQ